MNQYVTRIPLTCKVGTCPNTGDGGRGFCEKHYAQLRRRGAFQNPGNRADRVTPYGTTLGEWMRDASCTRHDPDLWFPEGRGSHPWRTGKAIAICLECPVITDCDKTINALPAHERYGVWAGRYYHGE